MKTLTLAAALIGILAAAPAMANGEGSAGTNQFHGSSTLVSYGAQPSARAETGSVAVRQDAATPGLADKALVWGEAAVDPLYDNLSAQSLVIATAGQPAATAMASSETDFSRAYAN
ncbi:hypothetical protein [Arenibaculum pallidiluteum]|uniref:hypothetical protein n=1 Tax=Arenibaculum pallidiluteum TaxID=2812559 RepID=UPI001A958E23|nr:hypothetical protein [Arenibaculum pallidiluteum]